MDAEAKYVATADVPFLENYHAWADVHQYFEVLASNFTNLAAGMNLFLIILGSASCDGSMIY